MKIMEKMMKMRKNKQKKGILLAFSIVFLGLLLFQFGNQGNLQQISRGNLNDSDLIGDAGTISTTQYVEYRIDLGLTSPYGFGSPVETGEDAGILDADGYYKGASIKPEFNTYTAYARASDRFNTHVNYGSGDDYTSSHAVDEAASWGRWISTLSYDIDYRTWFGWRMGEYVYGAGVPNIVDSRRASSDVYCESRREFVALNTINERVDQLRTDSSDAAFYVDGNHGDIGYPYESRYPHLVWADETVMNAFVSDQGYASGSSWEDEKDDSLYDSYTSGTTKEWNYFQHAKITNNFFFDPQVGLDYARVSFQMVDTFDVEQEMNVPLEIPSGWEIDAAILTVSNLWLPKGVELQGDVNGDEGYARTILDTYYTDINANIDVTDCVNDGTLDIRIYGDDYDDITTAFGGSGTDHEKWIGYQYPAISGMELKCVIKQSSPVDYSVVSNSIHDSETTYTQTALVYNPDHGTLKGSHWITPRFNRIEFDLSADRSGNPFLTRDYVLTSIDGDTTFIVDFDDWDYDGVTETATLHSSIGESPYYYFTNEFVGGEYFKIFEFEWTDKYKYIDDVNLYGVFEKGLHGSINLDNLIPTSKIISGEEICIGVDLSSEMESNYATTFSYIDLSYEFTGTAFSYGGGYDIGKGDFKMGDLVYMYDIIPNYKGFLDLTIIISTSDDDDKIIHAGIYEVIDIAECNYYTYSNFGTSPSAYNSTHLEWDFDLDTISGGVKRNVMVGAVELANDLTTQQIYEPISTYSWAADADTFPAPLSLSEVNSKENILLHDRTFNVELKFYWNDASTPSLTITDFAIYQYNNHSHAIYRDSSTSAITLNAMGNQTLTYTIDLSNKLLYGDVILRNAPYIFAFNFSVAGWSLGSNGYHEVFSYDNTTDSTMKNSIVFMGIPDPSTDIPDWDDNKGSPSYWGDYIHLIDYHVYNNATIGHFNTILLSSVDLNHFATVVVGTENPFAARNYINTAVSGQNYPTINVITKPESDGVPWRMNIYDVLHVKIQALDVDDDVNTVEYNLKNSTDTFVSWTSMTDLMVNDEWELNHVDVFNTLGMYPSPYSEPYNLTIRIEDDYFHVKEKTYFIDVRSYQPTLIDWELQRNGVPITTKFPKPTFFRYDYIDFNLELNDLDNDINDPQFLTIETLDGTVMQTVPLISTHYPSLNKYVFINGSRIDLTLLDDDDYVINYTIIDDWGNEFHDFIEFDLDITSPSIHPLIDPIPNTAEGNTFTHHDNITAEIIILDLDMDISNVKINVTEASGQSFEISDFTPSTFFYDEVFEYYNISHVFENDTYWDQWEDGQYKIYFKITDDYGNYLEYFVNIWIVSYEPENLIINSPIGDNYIYDDVDIDFSVTDLDFDLITTNAKYHIFNDTYNSSWIIADFVSESGGIYNFNDLWSVPVSVYLGGYNINITVTDRLGNSATIIGGFSLTSNSPSVVITNPSIDNRFIRTDTPTLEATVTDIDGDLVSVWYQLFNSSSGEFINSLTEMVNVATDDYESPTPLDFSSFYHNTTIQIFVFGIDGLGNNASAGRRIYLDVFDPIISNVRPNILAHSEDVFTSYDLIEISCDIRDDDDTTLDVAVKIKEFDGSYESTWFTMTYGGIFDPHWYYTFDPSSLMNVSGTYYEVFIKAIDGRLVEVILDGNFFAMENQFPVINDFAPLDFSTWNYNDIIHVWGNVSDAEQDIDTVTYSLYYDDGSTLILDNIPLPLEMYYPIDDYYIYEDMVVFPPLPNDDYYLVLNVTDDYALSRIANHTISLYNYFPEIIDIEPAEYTVINYQETILVKVNVSDIDMDVISVELQTIEDGVPIIKNMVASSIYGITQNWTYDFNFENHTANETMPLIFYITDDYGHVISDTLYYTIESYPPVITVNMPLDDEDYSFMAEVPISVSIHDIDDDLLTVTAHFKLGVAETSPMSLVYDSFDDAWEGDYDLSVIPFLAAWDLVITATDAASNVVIDDSVSINVMNYPPSVDIDNPTNLEIFTNDFTIVADISDLDNNLDGIWFQLIGVEYFEENLTLDNATYYTYDIDINSFKWGDYVLSVHAMDALSQETHQIISIQFHHPEILMIAESAIVYQEDDVDVRSFVTARVTLNHTLSIESRHTIAIIPWQWDDAVNGKVRRGVVEFNDLDLINATRFEFLFTTFQATDLLEFTVETPDITFPVITSPNDQITYYEYAITSKRNFTNIGVLDEELFLGQGTFEFTLEVQEGLDWVVVDPDDYSFVVTGDYQKVFSLVIPEISRGDTVRFRVVVKNIQLEPVNTQPWVYAAVIGLAGGIGGNVFVYRLRERSKKLWLALAIGIPAGAFFGTLIISAALTGWNIFGALIGLL